MKKLIILTGVIFSLSFGYSLDAYAQYQIYEPIPSIYGKKVNDGNYKATVRYTNYATNYKATYSLKVQVRYGRVTAIYFEDGGSIHSGFNNSGYLYQGGTIQYSYDSDGDITSAVAKVTITEGSDTRVFVVSLD
jgi:hypothetical protein